MNPGDHGDRQSEGSSPSPDASGGASSPPGGPNRDVFSTTDPIVEAGPGGGQVGRGHPDETIVAETNRVTTAPPAYQAATSAYVEPSRPAPKDRAGDEARREQDPGKVDTQDGKAKDPRKAGAEDDPGTEAHRKRRGRIGLVITLISAIACGMAGAWVYNRFLGPESKADDQAKGDPKKDDSNQDAAPKAEAKKKASDPDKSTSMTGSDADSLKKQIQYLGSRIDVLQQKISSMSSPKDTNPPDFEALRTKVGELSDTIHATISNPDRSRQIEERLDRMQGDVKSLRDQLSSLKGRVSSQAEASTRPEPDRKDDKPRFQLPPPPGPSPAEATAPLDDAMATGIALFKKSQYLQADEAFRQLRLTRPQDARVWYFSALAHGFATGQWEGETRRFVVHGADQERAGVPSSSQIDTAFADLSPAQGKEWLNSYRAQLAKP